MVSEQIITNDMYTKMHSLAIHTDLLYKLTTRRDRFFIAAKCMETMKICTYVGLVSTSCYICSIDNRIYTQQQTETEVRA